MKKSVLAIFLSVILLMSSGVSAFAADEIALEGLEPEYYIALQGEATDAQDDAMLLGSLSAKYESNGNPATISEGKDTGGVSYGAYQFSSVYGVPLAFANWCVSSGKGVVTGNTLLNAYALDGNSYSDCFNTAWKSIAEEDSAAFLLLQHEFTKARFYDVMVAKLESQIPGFKVDNYTLALKNVIWSRTVQQGVNSDVIFKAFENLGGFNNQKEYELIRAIYAQSSLLVNTPPTKDSIPIERSSAEKYGIDPNIVAGKYMYYYSRNSSDIQASVYRRLAVNELDDALKMYEKYSGEKVPPAEPAQPEEKPTSIFSMIINIMLDLFKMFISFILSLIG